MRLRGIEETTVESYILSIFSHVNVFIAMSKYDLQLALFRKLSRLHLGLFIDSYSHARCPIRIEHFYIKRSSINHGGF